MESGHSGLPRQFVLGRRRSLPSFGQLIQLVAAILPLYRTPNYLMTCLKWTRVYTLHLERSAFHHRSRAVLAPSCAAGYTI